MNVELFPLWCLKIYMIVFRAVSAKAHERAEEKLS